MNPYLRLGDLLVSKGMLTEEQLDAALVHKAESGLRLGESLVAMGLCDEAAIVGCLASQYDLPILDPTSLKVSRSILSLISTSFAMKNSVIPIGVSESEIHCVMADPLDLKTSDEIAEMTGKRVRLSIAGYSQVFDMISKFYGIQQAPVNAKLDEDFSVGVSQNLELQQGGKQKSPKKARINCKASDQSDRNDLLSSLTKAGENGMFHWGND